MLFLSQFWIIYMKSLLRFLYLQNVGKCKVIYLYLIYLSV